MAKHTKLPPTARQPSTRERLMRFDPNISERPVRPKGDAKTRFSANLTARGAGERAPRYRHRPDKQ